MKLYTKFFFLFCLVGLFSMAGCQKSVEDNFLTKEHLAGTYKVTGLIYTSPTGLQQDIFSSLPDCDKESKQVLNANSTYEFIDACTPPEDHTGTWDLLSSSKIVIDGEESDLISFDGHNLKIAVSDLGGSVGGKITETLARQ